MFSLFCTETVHHWQNILLSNRTFCKSTDRAGSELVYGSETNGVFKFIIPNNILNLLTSSWNNDCWFYVILIVN